MPHSPKAPAPAASNFVLPNKVVPKIKSNVSSVCGRVTSIGTAKRPSPVFPPQTPARYLLRASYACPCM